MRSIRWAIAVAACLSIAGCVLLTPPEAPPVAVPAPDLPPPGLPNGVAAGDVTQESAVLWARAADPGVVTFTIQLQTTAGTGDDPLSAPLTRTVTEPLLPVTVTVTGLSPAADYRYQATIANGDSAAGHFHTPAGEGERRGLRFAATGDVRGDLAPYPAIANAPARDLDFFVNLGDTIYADVPSPAVPKQAQTIEEFRLKQDEVNSTERGLNTLASLRASTISFATLDDHEILNNVAGGAPANSSRYFAENSGLINETRLYRAGLDAFLIYQPTQVETYGSDADARMAGRPRIYRYRTFGADAALFVLDMRSFRDEPLPRVTDLDDADTRARFEQASFDPARTILGADQMAELQRDLLDAQQRGITWKFVVSPDPMQYLDMTAAPDRWQGYAAERTALLRFIAEEGIANVVFITADIHGTVVNNLTYQEGPGEPQIPVAAWEIAVGPVAAHPPFGLAMFLTYLQLGMLTDADEAHYESLPVRHDSDDTPDDRDDYVKGLINEQMARFGYNPFGLADVEAGEAAIEAELLQGDYMAGHVYGWSEFEIDATSQALTVTTYGIPAYVANEMAHDAEAIVARMPEVVSQFVVQARE
ncbi:MAG: alkaline phosphatase D family protein [Caldilineaceae bacterium]|nr:alkaline phosphatase D family protein [Caldilineaceae bacterium]